MSVGLWSETKRLGLVVLGCDYITNLGLEELTSREEIVRIVGTASDTTSAAELIVTEGADMVLVDAAIPSQTLLSWCRTLSQLPQAPVVVVMGDLEFSTTEELLSEGASAVIDQSLVAEDLPALLRLVHSGGAVMVSGEALRVLKNRNIHGNIQQKNQVDSLNKRERAVAYGVADGLTNAQLASQMLMSEATIKLLVSNVMSKLGVSNRVGIAVVVTRARMH